MLHNLKKTLTTCKSYSEIEAVCKVDTLTYTYFCEIFGHSF